jgi:biopolymer transport protein TolR
VYKPKRRVSNAGVVKDINVVPMADIMLVLLIIFMLATPLLQTGVSLNLPRAQNPLETGEPDAADAVVISITRSGQVYRARTPVTDEQLYDFLVQRFSAAEIQNRTIFLRADTALPYGRVVEIVNGSRDAGVDRIGLMTEKDN